VPGNEEEETVTIGERIIDSIVAGRLVTTRGQEPVVLVWAPNAASQITALVDAEREEQREDRGYTAMERSRRKQDW